MAALLFQANSESNLYFAEHILDGDDVGGGGGESESNLVLAVDFIPQHKFSHTRGHRTITAAPMHSRLMRQFARSRTLE